MIYSHDNSQSGLLVVTRSVLQVRINLIFRKTLASTVNKEDADVAIIYQLLWTMTRSFFTISLGTILTSTPQNCMLPKDLGPNFIWHNFVRAHRFIGIPLRDVCSVFLFSKLEIEKYWKIILILENKLSNFGSSSQPFMKKVKGF